MLYLLLFAPIVQLSPPAPTCAGPADCSYNGECNSGACTCDAAWLGEHCEKLNLVPMRRLAGLNVSTTIGGSWGGTVNQGGDDGKWHMHVAQFVRKCGFNQWASNSRVVHAGKKNLARTSAAQRAGGH